MALRIAHVSFSSSGGAGGVATRLAASQRDLGHDAVVVSHISGSLRDRPWATPQHTALAAIDDFVVREGGFRAPISLFRDSLGSNLSRQLSGADVIHLHWPNGWFTLESLPSLPSDTRLVWTLHDMNPFTGACHYSLGCTSFESGCESCPAVRTAFRPPVSQHLEAKRQSLRTLPRMRVVSPSGWLADQARASSVFSDFPIEVIPNPLPKMGSINNSSDVRSRWGFAQDAVVFAIVAGNLEDPVKNVAMAIDAFEASGSGREGTKLLLIGRGSSKLVLPEGVVRAGHLGSQELRAALGACDYLVVTSLAENQPLAIAEAQAMGMSIVVSNSTGLPEHLDIDPDGHTVDTVEDLVGIYRKANKKSAASRNSLAKRARKKFDAKTIARRYLQIYQSG